MEEDKPMGYGTREDLRDILSFVKNMGSLVGNKGMEATGQSYIDAVEETEWILADYDMGDVPSLETAHKIDSVLRNFRIEYLVSMIENK